MKEGLYIHIPYCRRKCGYCGFISYPLPAGNVPDELIDLLLQEMRFYEERLGRLDVDTVFIGGGTPSLLAPSQFERLMKGVRQRFDVAENAEITSEANPDSLSEEVLAAMAESGINRLSMGAQSLDNTLLSLLGRIHDRDGFLRAYERAAAAGFDNINIDLMSALPGQTFETWADSLRQAVEWKPEHISAYSLIIEPGTPFSDLYDSGKLPALPDEETDRSMYHYTRRFLAQHGYERYKISNYALPGRECRHNSGYWTGHPYLGFGIGAASYVNGTRFSNTADFEAYLSFCEDDLRADNLCKDDHHEDGLCEDIRTDVHVLSQEEKMEEFMFLGLRMTDGVSEPEFERRFGVKLEDAFGSVLHRHLEQNVVCRTSDHRISLTEYGLDVANYVMADYLL
jgi:oxygen-independent coproporphyrinogen-3 oxidase